MMSFQLARSGMLRSITLLLFLLLPLSGAQELTDNQINLVSARLTEGAKQSWELGTRAQTILELNATTYSVFNTDQSLPPPSGIPSALSSNNALVPFFSIAKTTVTSRSNDSGPQPLIPDGSAADPASIGVCVLIANLTGQDRGQVDYDGAAREQLEYLLSSTVPKTSDGAISHRVQQLQLWSDFMYMVPPFLAYYGVTTRNRTILAESYNQIKLYRNYLRDPKQGMWRHIMLGASGNDNGFWSTGNGWAAAGMLRVIGTMRQSEYANTFKNEQKDLANWVREIHAAIYPRLDKTNIFTNYADQPPTSQGNFYDAASTAFLASTVYRAAILLNQFTYLPYAERSRKTLSTSNSTSTSNANGTLNGFNGYDHFTQDGWLRPVVNPHSFGQAGSESPEAQAFVVQMHAAWKEWEQDGSRGANDARRTRGVGAGLLGVGVGAVVGGLLTVAL